MYSFSKDINYPQNIEDQSCRCMLQNNLKVTRNLREKSSWATSISNFMDLTKYSTLRKLLRVTSYILRFIHDTRNPSDQRKGPLTFAELTSSQRKWIVDRQHYHYATELASISSPTKSRPPLTRQLRLFIDDNGLLRCGGRI